MSNIIDIYNDFRNEVEKKQFIEMQHKTMLALMEKNKQLEQEVAHLKELLISSTPDLSDSSKVEKVLLTPEEALIEKQIELIQARGWNMELTLEDTKKLDLLIKNKHVYKDNKSTIKGESRNITTKALPTSALLQLAQTKKE